MGDGASLEAANGAWCIHSDGRLEAEMFEVKPLSAAGRAAIFSQGFPVRVWEQTGGGGWTSREATGKDWKRRAELMFGRSKETPTMDQEG